MPRGPEGDIDKAAAQAGPGDWIDLSGRATRRPWPVPVLPDRRCTNSATERLAKAAAAWFGCRPDQVLAVGCPPMRLVARLLPAGLATLLPDSPPAHRACLHAADWTLAGAPAPEAVGSADLALAATPGLPDGREWPPEALARMAGRVGHLVVDERLADARPDLSLAPCLPPNAVVLRSLGPLWGLTGLRLHVVLAEPALLARLSKAAAACPADDAALRLGALALTDRTWARASVLYHAEAALRLDRIAVGAGWRPAGGTHLFRLYDTDDAPAARDRLARARIRAGGGASPGTRLRLGIPATRREWDRLAAALHTE